jgi:hypothetical protein
MGLFSSRMTDAEKAKAKGDTRTANQTSRLARTALGDNATRVQREHAAAELERRHGKKGAARIIEEELQKAGAKKRGLFG